MDRRSILKGLLLVGTGGAGYAAYSMDLIPDSITSAISDFGGPPPTDNQIGSTRTFDAGPFKRLTFYESGAAEVYFKVGHDTDQFGITHSSLDVLEDSFQTWGSPTYEGPKVINLKRIIENNGPYPSNRFQIGVYYDPTQTIHFGISTRDFRVPDAWYSTTT